MLFAVQEGHTCPFSRVCCVTFLWSASRIVSMKDVHTLVYLTCVPYLYPLYLTFVPYLVYLSCTLPGYLTCVSCTSLGCLVCTLYPLYLTLYPLYLTCVPYLITLPVYLSCVPYINSFCCVCGPASRFNNIRTLVVPHSYTLPIFILLRLWTASRFVSIEIHVHLSYLTCETNLPTSLVYLTYIHFAAFVDCIYIL